MESCLWFCAPMEAILRAREQFGDPAHRRGVHGESPLGREPGQVMRPAGLRAGAGEAFAAEGLHSNYRSMIGAVVGVQPFGGEGLSGTGPKAGGPHYLPRFATERTLTVNTAAMGGVTELLTRT